MPDLPDATHNPVVLVTGGSAGLGLAIAETFAVHGFRVAIVGRNRERLEQAASTIQTRQNVDTLACPGDVTCRDDCDRIAQAIDDRWKRLDVLVNCVGASDRGLTQELTADRLHELIDANVTGTLVCSQSMHTLLQRSSGSIVNIGSLAGKVGARYLGGYNASKHAVTGLTQQMRLEWRERGIHVGLVSPGPIRREDAGRRYADRADESLPESASAPGGGTNFRGLDPYRVARAVVDCAKRRRPDVILPGYMRLLITIGNAFPRLGDWLLLKFTKG